MTRASSQEELKVYDPLWEENSKVRRIRAESEAEGFAEGKAEGLVKGLQMALTSAIRVCFPELAELAQQKVVKISNTSHLEMLLKQVITAPDANAVCWIIDLAAT